MSESQKVVFLADDDEGDRLFLIEAILEVDPKVEIIEAHDGMNLIDILTNKKYLGHPSLIVMDLNMPRLNGLETMKILNADAQIQNIPAIMLSTSSDQNSSRNALKAGFREYFIKPYHIQGFVSLAAILKAKYLG